MEILIRQEAEADFDSVYEVVKEAFLNAEYTNHDEQNSSLALSIVSVLPDMQGKGIGENLILGGHKIALELGFNSVIVVGHPGYYPRFGYVSARRFGITASFDVPDEVFMANELIANALSDTKGVVEYPKEFLT